MASELSQRLEDCLAAHVAPLISSLGFQPRGAPKNPKVGLVARTYVRPLSGGSSLVLSVWCDGGTGRDLTWRLDVDDGQGHADLQLTFPYEISGRPVAGPLGGSHHLLGEFRPHLGPEHFDRAVQSLACQLAAHGEEIASQVPELATELGQAIATPEWQALRAQGPVLWARRYVEQEDHARLETGEVGFAGENLVRVHTESGRYSFKVPALGVAKGDQAELSGWWQTPAGTWTPRVLAIGSLRKEFDFFGRLRE